jgi:hypothetical protein
MKRVLGFRYLVFGIWYLVFGIRLPGRAFSVAAALLLSAGWAAAKEDVITCANLIYGNNTSRCFSDEFLSAVQTRASLATARRFKSVKLASEELFQFPFVVMTGESDFRLTAAERENLKRYVTSGGFLLASAGCSSRAFDTAFRREIRAVLGESALAAIPMDHAVFKTVAPVGELRLRHAGGEVKLEGHAVDGKLTVIYSHHGLNDTVHTQGCCCCGGNEIVNSLDVNVNILVYALLH